MAVLRHMGEAARAHARRVALAAGRPARRAVDLAAHGGVRMPAIASSSSRLAVAGDAGDADDLAGAHVEGDVVDHGDAAAVRARSGRDRAASTVAGRRPAPFSTRSSTRRPTISSASSPRLVSAVSRVATISPRRMTETVSVIAMISRSLWVMRMTVLPSSAQLPQDAEQVVGLGRRQHAGRLVEDQDLGAAIQRLQDLDALLQADGQSPIERVGIDLEAVVALRAASARRARGRCRAPRKRPPLGAEHDVLEHGEIARPA